MYDPFGADIALQAGVCRVYIRKRGHSRQGSGVTEKEYSCADGMRGVEACLLMCEALLYEVDGYRGNGNVTIGMSGWH